MHCALANFRIRALAFLLAFISCSTALAQSSPTVNWVPNPTSGINIYTLTYRPTNATPGTRYPAIVFVPGGVGTNATFSAAVMQAQADQGFIAVSFDPDGRGLSTGSGTFTFEDFGGTIQQDGLHQVLKYVSMRTDVYAENIFVQSRSFGVTMSAGAIARYPHTPQVKAFVQWEGPADRTDTASMTGHDVTDNAWWFSHEPINFIDKYQGDFILIQSQFDHAQPDHLHTIKLNNRAVNLASGGSGRSRLARVNGPTGAGSNPVNQIYVGTILASTLPETTALEPFMRGIMQEMVARPVRPRIGDINGNGSVDGADLTMILSAWGTNNVDADLNDDRQVNGADIASLLAAWTTGGGSTGPWNNNIDVYVFAPGASPVRVHTFPRAGVSTVASFASGELIAAFQWFPETPVESFDRIAFSRSLDNGLTWTAPTTIVLTGLVADDRSPFDPTLAILDDGRIRLYFTMNKLTPGAIARIGSAISTDGVHFALEPGDRLAVSGQMVIDCAVGRVNGVWQLTSPIQAADGTAYRATSPDGLNFVRQADLAGPQTNRWLGAMIQIPKGLRFYGTSNTGIWSARSTNGATWVIDSATYPVAGADPGVVALPNGSILMTVTGPAGGG